MDEGLAQTNLRPVDTGPLEYQKFRDVRFFGSLDGLRAISILGVIWFHTWYQTPYYATLMKIPVLRIGSFGVHIFFGISGFLITTLLLREEERYGRISLSNFYMRRALRIWPVYYATLGLYTALVLITERLTDRGHVFFHFLPGYLTYTYTWFAGNTTEGPIFNFAWSLATEEQFYGFWPVILKFFRGWRASLVMGALVVLHSLAVEGVLGRVVAANSLPIRILGSVAVPICLGALLAQALHWKRGFEFLYYLLGRKWSALASLGLLAVSLYPVEPVWPLAWVGLTSFVGACVIREDNTLAPILRLRPIAYIGVLSYGMYLFNTLAVKIVRTVLSHAGIAHPLATFPVIVAVTAGVAFLSYRYFESPFLAMKSRFSRPRRSADSAPQPVVVGVSTDAA